MPVTITRRLTFEAGHRLVGHESKCKHLHGHSYKAYITITAPDLDPVGRVIDFSVVKQLVGGWIDANWDHAFIGHKDDPLVKGWNWSADRLDALFGTERMLARLFVEVFSEKPPYIMDCNPTAENMAKELFNACERVLPAELSIVSVRLDETENCSAVYTPGDTDRSRNSAKYPPTVGVGSWIG